MESNARSGPDRPTEPAATPRLIGLTGGIACGKSAVAAALRALGVAVVDADLLAREAVEPGTPALAAIAAQFGPRALRPDGTLDRAAVAAIVFADADARAKLNAIVHPEVARLSAERIAAAAAAGHPLVVYEAALLVENGTHHALGGGLVVVTCSPATQRARLVARDGLDAAAAQARIDAQLPLVEKERAATWLLRNDGTLEELRQQVEALWRTWQTTTTSSSTTTARTTAM